MPILSSLSLENHIGRYPTLCSAVDGNCFAHFIHCPLSDAHFVHMGHLLFTHFADSAKNVPAVVMGFVLSGLDGEH